ncbi:cytochrome P450 [Phenylobacterium sp. LjRoot219]|uniref:cytochrome P450 n=1 Tax=Phenylobacterium sp. LjRoot219 TaxID=3342283 RepID=UPI003ECFA5DD
MPTLDDLELEQLAVGTPEFAADPLPQLAAARAKHPWLARSEAGYVVTDYAAMKEILSLDDKLAMSVEQIVDIMGAHGTGWGRFTLEMMLARSGPEHQRLRGSVAEAFTPRSVNRLRPLMRSVVSELLDEWAPKGEFDFCEFAANFPVAVMFRLIGASPAAIPRIRSSLEVQGSSYALIPEMMPTIEAHYQTLWRFVDELIVERGPAGGHGDLLDDLIAANVAGALTDVELRQMLIFLFGAGYDTSKNQLTLIMQRMLDHPEIWRRCAEDRPFCDKVVEEGLRFASPSNIYRSVTEAFEYRGVTLPAGAMLFFPTTLAARDAQHVPRPDVFDPERTHTNRHLAFGRGMHICLGQFMARAQIEEGVHLIAQRLANPRLAGEVTWRPFPGVWGIKSLPIVFEPAPPRSAPAELADAQP